MAACLFFMVSNATAQTCTGCTNTMSGGGNAAINVTTGETLCLVSGTFHPSSLTIASGGTLCIGTGATLAYNNYGFSLAGNIINHGILTFKGSGNVGTGTIDNYGTVSQTGYIGDFGLTVNNHGTITIEGQIGNGSATITNDTNAVFKTTNTIRNFSGMINNYGLFQANEFMALSSTYIDNRDSFVVVSSTELKGTFDNSGYASFKNLTSGSGLSATVNNYGVFKATGSLNVGDATYFTNDSLTVFDIPGGVNFSGPMLTNNNRLNTTGDFEVNNSSMDFVNTGMLYVGGAFQYNDAATGANNCRIFAVDGIIIHGANFKNYGLLWTTKAFEVTNGSLINGKTGFIRGVNFSNNDSISGYGVFYMTGSSIKNAGGDFNGSSSSDKIKFYTPNGNGFPSNSSHSLSNVTFLPTSSLTPLDTNSFSCGSAPSIPAAGNPPFVQGDTLALCDVAPVTFHLITDSLLKPYDNTYNIYWPALKLFSVGGSENTINLTTAEGTWQADTTNKTIVFTPAPSFTTGIAQAQFKAANKKPGDPITYTSNKATLIIHLNSVSAPAILEVEGY